MGMLSTEEVVDEDIRKEEKVRSISDVFYAKSRNNKKAINTVLMAY